MLEPYFRLCETLGQAVTQLPATARSRASRSPTAVTWPSMTPPRLTSTVVRGLLAPISEETVNLVNAPTIARRRGWRVSERKRGTRGMHE